MIVDDNEALLLIGIAGQRLRQFDKYLAREITYSQFRDWQPPKGPVVQKISNNARSRGRPSGKQPTKVYCNQPIKEH